MTKNKTSTSLLTFIKKLTARQSAGPLSFTEDLGPTTKRQTVKEVDLSTFYLYEDIMEIIKDVGYFPDMPLRAWMDVYSPRTRNYYDIVLIDSGDHLLYVVFKYGFDDPEMFEPGHTSYRVLNKVEDGKAKAFNMIKNSIPNLSEDQLAKLYIFIHGTNPDIDTETMPVIESGFPGPNSNVPPITAVREIPRSNPIYNYCLETITNDGGESLVASKLFEIESKRWDNDTTYLLIAIHQEVDYLGVSLSRLDDEFNEYDFYYVTKEVAETMLFKTFYSEIPFTGAQRGAIRLMLRGTFHDFDIDDESIVEAQGLSSANEWYSYNSERWAVREGTPQEYDDLIEFRKDEDGIFRYNDYPVIQHKLFVGQSISEDEDDDTTITYVLLIKYGDDASDGDFAITWYDEDTDLLDYFDVDPTTAPAAMKKMPFNFLPFSAAQRFEIRLFFKGPIADFDTDRENDDTYVLESLGRPKFRVIMNHDHAYFNEAWGLHESGRMPLSFKRVGRTPQGDFDTIYIYETLQSNNHDDYFANYFHMPDDGKYNYEQDDDGIEGGTGCRGDAEEVMYYLTEEIDDIIWTSGQLKAIELYLRGPVLDYEIED